MGTFCYYLAKIKQIAHILMATNHPSNSAPVCSSNHYCNCRRQNPSPLHPVYTRFYVSGGSSVHVLFCVLAPSAHPYAGSLQIISETRLPTYLIIREPILALDMFDSGGTLACTGNQPLRTLVHGAPFCHPGWPQGNFRPLDFVPVKGARFPPNPQLRCALLRLRFLSE